MKTETSLWVKILIALLALSAAGVVGYAGYTGYQNYQSLKQTKASLEQELATTKQEYASTTLELTTNIDALKQLLGAINADRSNTEQDLRQQKEIIDSMSVTLGVYEKLVNTDRELLAKYSRVYFLSENYIPKHTSLIPPANTYDPKKENMVLSETLPFLENMLNDATAANVDLKVISAYRSFSMQAKIKTAYTVTYGSGSNRFSADQGYSEHQLGTAVDFTTTKLGTNFSTFEKTTSYPWLTENAYKYGFILSYPKKNTYYIFEPWHWRFVGKALALRLHNENKNFVDLPQRDLNEYLVSLFDGSPVIK